MPAGETMGLATTRWRGPVPAGVPTLHTVNGYPRAAQPRADELNDRALSLLDLGRDAEAGESFKAALAADPWHLPAAYNNGLRRWRAAEITDTALVSSLEDLRARLGDPQRARRLLAQVHGERGDFAAAASLLGQAPGDAGLLAAMRRESDPGEDAAIDVPWNPEPRAGQSPGPGERVTIRLSTDGEAALAGAWDGTVRQWDVRGGRPLRTLGSHREAVHRVSVTADGRFGVSASLNEVRCWDLASGECTRRFAVPAWDVQISPSGTFVLATAPHANGVMRLDVGTGEYGRFFSDRVEVKDLAVSDHGTWAAASFWGMAGGVLLWDIRGGQGARLLHEDGDGKVTAICFSRDERLVVTGAYFGRIRVWSASSGECLRVLTGHSGSVRALELTADARFLVSGGSRLDGTVRQWEVSTGRCVRTCEGHRDAVEQVLVGGGGRAALSAGQDNSARWWVLPGDRGYTSPPALAGRPAT